MHYKPRHTITIEVPRSSATRTDDTVLIQPQIIESTWTRNDHLSPDELRVTIDYRDAGLDIRQMQNARCAFYLWDDMASPNAPSRNVPRFTGILMKPERELNESTSHVELVFHDWTQLFREKKPYPSEGIPDWNNTLPDAWRIICAHTGYWDPNSGEIVSSVEALKERLVFDDPSIAEMTIGDVINSRFHAISKPTPPTNADAWEVWQYIVGSLGLISWIDRDTCRVARVKDHFREDNAPAFLWGHNVLSLSENSDPKITGKGVLLRSFDPLTGRVLEAHYPPIGDPRVKRRRVRVPSAKSTGKGTFHDPLNDYVPYNFGPVSDQAELERRAQDVYEQLRRQELKGKLTTAEMVIVDQHGRPIGDLLDLEAGDSIRVDVDPETSQHWRSIDGGSAARIAYLMSRGYRRDVAAAIDQNWQDAERFTPIYHVESMTTNLRHGQFQVEVGYHSLIRV